VAFNFSEISNFDVKLQVFQQNMQRQVVGVLSTFFSFIFSKAQSSHHVVHDIKPLLQGLGDCH
jgi:hypothetical protein